MTPATPPVLYISADTSDLTTRYKATPRMHMAAKAWYPEETVEALVECVRYARDMLQPESCSRFFNMSDRALAALPAPDEGEQGEWE